MQETIHLVPKSLKDKIAVHDAANAARAAKGQPPLPDLTLTAADFKSMSGRVVVLRELSIPEIEKAEKSAFRRIDDSTVNAEFEGFRQGERMRAMIVAVSDEHVDPRQRMTAKTRPVTAADLEGVAMAGEASTDGTKQGNGRSFGELFTAKDLAVLRTWDRKHHSVMQEDVDDILGEAIPTASD